MIPGHDQIIACPKCKGLARYMTLRTGNTLGEEVWSDGKRVYPMMSRPPSVVKCRHCEECYWLNDAQKVGMGVDRWEIWRKEMHWRTQESDRGNDLVYSEDLQENPDWAAAENVKEPTEEEYYQALEQGLATTPAAEKTLRILAWWRRNDAFREDTPFIHCTPPTGAARRNLEALANIMETEGDEGLVMKAEVLRELGDFESAEQALSRVSYDEFTEVARVARKIRLLCFMRYTCVKEVW